MKVIILSPDLFVAPSPEGLFAMFGLLATGAMLSIIGLCSLFGEYKCLN